MTDPAMINFLEAARSLSLDRRHKLMRQLMNYVLAEWPESPDAHVHMGNFLEWQALDEDNYRVMRKADVSYLKAIELAPDRIDVLYDYITFLIYFGNIDDAEKCLIFIKDRPSKKMVKEISLDIQEVKTRVDPAKGGGLDVGGGLGGGLAVQVTRTWELARGDIWDILDPWGMLPCH